MKLRLFLTIMIFGAEIAFAGRFDLPKENPQFSIQIPDNWQTVVEEDDVTSRPAKDAKVIISVFPVPTAKNLQDAFAIVTKKVSADYSDVKIGKVAEQKQAGLTFFGGQGEGEKDGFELIRQTWSQTWAELAVIAAKPRSRLGTRAFSPEPDRLTQYSSGLY